MRYITIAKIIIFCILTVIVATIVTDQIKRYECSSITELPTYEQTLTRMKGFRFVDEGARASSIAIAKYKIDKTDLKEEIDVEDLSDYALFKIMKSAGDIQLTYLKMINHRHYKDVIDGYDTIGNTFFNKELRSKAIDILSAHTQSAADGEMYSESKVLEMSDAELYTILTRDF